MGNRESSPADQAVAGPAPVEAASPYTGHYRALYADLTSPGSQGDTENKTTFKVRHFIIAII